MRRELRLLTDYWGWCDKFFKNEGLKQASRILRGVCFYHLNPNDEGRVNDVYALRTEFLDELYNADLSGTYESKRMIDAYPTVYEVLLALAKRFTEEYIRDEFSVEAVFEAMFKNLNQFDSPSKVIRNTQGWVERRFDAVSPFGNTMALSDSIWQKAQAYFKSWS